jgi:hypothetical protein
MLPRKRAGRVEQARTMKTHAFPPMALSDEIDRIVDERRMLRNSGAPEPELEANRMHLMAAQAKLTQVLVERHFDQRS